MHRSFSREDEHLPPLAFALHRIISAEMSSMIDILRQRASGISSSSRQAISRSNSIAEDNLASMSAGRDRERSPYETPCANGRCYMDELPGEVLSRIFLKLDRVSLTRSFRASTSGPNTRPPLTSSYAKA
jgi:hypothetical protein